MGETRARRRSSEEPPSVAAPTARIGPVAASVRPLSGSSDLKVEINLKKKTENDKNERMKIKKKNRLKHVELELRLSRKWNAVR